MAGRGDGPHGPDISLALYVSQRDGIVHGGHAASVLMTSRAAQLATDLRGAAGALISVLERIEPQQS